MKEAADLGPTEAAAAETLVAALHADDLTRVRLLLHPYLHWTDASGRTRRGRNAVLALLGEGVPGPPAAVELRDGQIYRWIQGDSAAMG